jgi:hypothetical protein
MGGFLLQGGNGSNRRRAAVSRGAAKNLEVHDVPSKLVKRINSRRGSESGAPA